MIVDFPNLGYTKNVLTETQLFPINAEINKIKNDFEHSIPNNTLLAGNINREYGMVDCYSYAEQLLLPYMKEYQSSFDYYKDRNVKLNSLWVNYQRKHEFNPLHTHIGILSFVIWVNIPFTNEEEAAVAPGRYSNMFSPGNFQFVFSDSIGNINKHLIPADKSYENTMLVFPATLNHQVHPFYSSNEYRISVSGNFVMID